MTVADPADAALEELMRLRDAEQDIDRQQLIAVARARRAGVSWQRIGEALQVARQSAWQRFGSSLSAVEDAWREAELSEEDAMALAEEALGEVRRRRGSR